MLFCRNIFNKRSLLASRLKFYIHNNIDHGGKGGDGKIQQKSSNLCPRLSENEEKNLKGEYGHFVQEKFFPAIVHGLMIGRLPFNDEMKKWA